MMILEERDRERERGLFTCRVSASALSPPYMPSTAVIMN
jgi:hypothetical protein